MEGDANLIRLAIVQKLFSIFILTYLNNLDIQLMFGALEEQKKNAWSIKRDKYTIYYDDYKKQAKIKLWWDKLYNPK